MDFKHITMTEQDMQRTREQIMQEVNGCTDPETLFFTYQFILRENRKRMHGALSGEYVWEGYEQ